MLDCCWGRISESDAIPLPFILISFSNTDATLPDRAVVGRNIYPKKKKKKKYPAYTTQEPQQFLARLADAALQCHAVLLVEIRGCRREVI